MPRLVPISHKDYMCLSDQLDKHSDGLMKLKGEEYSLDGDFLGMENRLAGMLGQEPEGVSLTMAGKHIVSLGIMMDKEKAEDIPLDRWDERIRDAINLLKISSAFIHAKQKDFGLKLRDEQKRGTEVIPTASPDEEV